MDESKASQSEDSPTISRFGRTRKPKITSDFCDIDEFLGMGKKPPKSPKSKPRSPQKITVVGGTPKIKKHVVKTTVIRKDSAAAQSPHITQMKNKLKFVNAKKEDIDFEESIDALKIVKTIPKQIQNKLPVRGMIKKPIINTYARRVEEYYDESSSEESDSDSQEHVTWNRPKNIKQGYQRGNVKVIEQTQNLPRQPPSNLVKITKVRPKNEPKQTFQKITITPDGICHIPKMNLTAPGRPIHTTPTVRKPRPKQSSLLKPATITQPVKKTPPKINILEDIIFVKGKDAQQEVKVEPQLFNLENKIQIISEEGTLLQIIDESELANLQLVTQGDMGSQEEVLYDSSMVLDEVIIEDGVVNSGEVYEEQVIEDYPLPEGTILNLNEVSSEAPLLLVPSNIEFLEDSIGAEISTETYEESKEELDADAEYYIDEGEVANIEEVSEGDGAVYYEGEVDDAIIYANEEGVVYYEGDLDNGEFEAAIEESASITSTVVQDVSTKSEDTACTENSKTELPPQPTTPKNEKSRGRSPVKKKQQVTVVSTTDNSDFSRFMPVKPKSPKKDGKPKKKEGDTTSSEARRKSPEKTKSKKQIEMKLPVVVEKLQEEDLVVSTSGEELIASIIPAQTDVLNEQTKTPNVIETVVEEIQTIASTKVEVPKSPSNKLKVETPISTSDAKRLESLLQLEEISDMLTSVDAVETSAKDCKNISDNFGSKLQELPEIKSLEDIVKPAVTSKSNDDVEHLKSSKDKKARDKSHSRSLVPSSSTKSEVKAPKLESNISVSKSHVKVNLETPKKLNVESTSSKKSPVEIDAKKRDSKSPSGKKEKLPIKTYEAKPKSDKKPVVKEIPSHTSKKPKLFEQSLKEIDAAILDKKPQADSAKKLESTPKETAIKSQSEPKQATCKDASDKRSKPHRKHEDSHRSKSKDGEPVTSENSRRSKSKDGEPARSENLHRSKSKDSEPVRSESLRRSKSKDSESTKKSDKHEGKKSESAVLKKSESIESLKQADGEGRRSKSRTKDSSKYKPENSSKSERKEKELKSNKDRKQKVETTSKIEKSIELKVSEEAKPTSEVPDATPLVERNTLVEVKDATLVEQSNITLIEQLNTSLVEQKDTSLIIEPSTALSLNTEVAVPNLSLLKEAETLAKQEDKKVDLQNPSIDTVKKSRERPSRSPNKPARYLDREIKAFVSVGNKEKQKSHERQSSDSRKKSKSRHEETRSRSKDKHDKVRDKDSKSIDKLDKDQKSSTGRKRDQTKRERSQEKKEESQEKVKAQAKTLEKNTTESQEKLKAETQEKINAELQEKIKAETQEKINVELQEKIKAESQEKINAELQAESQENITAESEEKIKAAAQDKIKVERQMKVKSRSQIKSEAESLETIKAEPQEIIKTKPQETIKSEPQMKMKTKAQLKIEVEPPKTIQVELQEESKEPQRKRRARSQEKIEAEQIEENTEPQMEISAKPQVEVNAEPQEKVKTEPQEKIKTETQEKRKTEQQEKIKTETQREVKELQRKRRARSQEKVEAAPQLEVKAELQIKAESQEEVKQLQRKRRGRSQEKVEETAESQEKIKPEPQGTIKAEHQEKVKEPRRKIKPKSQEKTSAESPDSESQEIPAVLQAHMEIKAKSQEEVREELQEKIKEEVKVPLWKRRGRSQEKVEAESQVEIKEKPQIEIKEIQEKIVAEPQLRVKPESQLKLKAELQSIKADFQEKEARCTRSREKSEETITKTFEVTAKRTRSQEKLAEQVIASEEPSRSKRTKLANVRAEVTPLSDQRRRSRRVSPDKLKLKLRVQVERMSAEDALKLEEALAKISGEAPEQSNISEVEAKLLEAEVEKVVQDTKELSKVLEVETVAAKPVEIATVEEVKPMEEDVNKRVTRRSVKPVIEDSKLIPETIEETKEVEPKPKIEVTKRRKGKVEELEAESPEGTKRVTRSGRPELEEAVEESNKRITRSLKPEVEEEVVKRRSTRSVVKPDVIEETKEIEEDTKRITRSNKLENVESEAEELEKLLEEWNIEDELQKKRVTRKSLKAIENEEVANLKQVEEVGVQEKRVTRGSLKPIEHDEAKPDESDKRLTRRTELETATKKRRNLPEITSPSEQEEKKEMRMSLRGKKSDEAAVWVPLPIKVEPEDPEESTVRKRVSPRKSNVKRRTQLGDILDDVEIIKRAIIDTKSPEKAAQVEDEGAVVEEVVEKQPVVEVLEESKKDKGKKKKKETILPVDIMKIKQEVIDDYEEQYISEVEDVNDLKDDVKQEPDDFPGFEASEYNEASKFDHGDLTYAKLGHYPYWPCLITEDPFMRLFKKKLTSSRRIPIWAYHVRFFGDRGRRAWVREANILPFTGKDDIPLLCEKLKGQGVPRSIILSSYKVPIRFQSMWNTGINEALSLQSKSIDQRYEFFFDMFASKMEKIAKLRAVKQEPQEAISIEIKKELIEEAEMEAETPEVTTKTRKRRSSPNKRVKAPVEIKQEFEEEARPKSQLSLDLFSEASLSDTDSTSKWSVRTPIPVTQESQTALYKRNALFKGVQRDRVCQICLQSGDVLKCKGKCYGYYHKVCSGITEERPLVEEEIEVSSDDGNDSDCQIISIKDKHERQIEPLTLNTDEAFKKMTLAEQLDFKLMEVMQPIADKTYYADSSSDYSSSEESSTEAEVVEHVTADDVIFTSKPLRKNSKAIKNDNFKCAKCIANQDPECFVCGKEFGPGNSAFRQKCSLSMCGKFYHKKCLRLWPQAQFSLASSSKGKDTETSDTFTCPMHVCHICVSDNPRAAISRLSSDKVVRCLRCPATYHSNTFCIPAGTSILSSTQIICPRHVGYDQIKGRAPRRTTINTTWCFICSQGGDLVCCETCPTSIHAECSRVNLLDDDTFMCEDCETGRLPLYDEIVWVKLGTYRWWPALILFPNDIPENIVNAPHLKGEFVVKFFGTHDHYWVQRGRVFLFQEGDQGPGASTKKMVDRVFNQAVEEAAAAHCFKTGFKKDKEDTIKIGEKPPPYIKIKINRPVGNVKMFDGNISNTTPCNCDPNGETPCSMDNYCLNRLLLTECDPEVCPARERCQNQSFEKREYPPLVPYRTKARGWGLKTLAPVRKGQFVIEYVGELIDYQECQRRMTKMHEQKEDNYYFLTINKDRLIDAGPKGNLSRFMNHCCEPNCETQKWTVKGETRVGLFAKTDIPEDTEVTFNYNLECVGEDKKICKCGAPACSGFIGVKAKNPNDEKKPKKHVGKLKKKNSPAPASPAINEPCFICGTVGNTFPCSNKVCPKYYHLGCVNLETVPEGKWSCPWHYCTVCMKRTIRCCVKCTKSYCPSHSEGNVRYDNLLGYVCTDHDPTKELQEILSNVIKKSRKSPIPTEESDVTSTTFEEIDMESDKDTSQEDIEASVGSKRKRGRPKRLHASKRQKLDNGSVKLTDSSQSTHDSIYTTKVPERHLRVSRKASEDSESERLLKRQRDFEKDLPIRKRTTPRTESTTDK